jgi:hypothetical protein
MRRNLFVVLALSGVLSLSGCLTPSEGRRADKALGETPPSGPEAVRDVPDAHLSGMKYRDSEHAADVRVDSRRSWQYDPMAAIYHELVSNTYFGLGSQGAWFQLSSPGAYADFSQARAGPVRASAPIGVERALDAAGY